MTFLPIVERELGLAAGRKSTYRIRIWTAVIAPCRIGRGTGSGLESGGRSDGPGATQNTTLSLIDNFTRVSEIDGSGIRS